MATNYVTTEVVEALKGSIENLASKHDEIAKSGEKFSTKEELSKLVEDVKGCFEAVQSVKKNMAQLANSNFAPKDNKESNHFNSFQEHIRANKKDTSIKITNEDTENYKNAFKNYLQKGTILDMEQKSLSIGQDIGGGYLVSPEYSKELLKKERDQHGLAGIIRRKTTGGHWKQAFNDSDYDQSKQTYETDTITASTEAPYKLLTFDNQAITYKMEISEDLIEDAFFDIESDLINELKMGIERTRDSLLVTGDGTKGIKGILKYDSGTSFNQINQIISGTSGVLTFADVISKMIGGLKGQYSGNAQFVMNHSTFYSLLMEVDSQGGYQIRNMANFFTPDNFAPTLLGKKVVFDESMPLVAANALSVAYGDFNKAYMMTEMPSYSIRRDGITKDNMIVFTLKTRCCAQLINGYALNLLKIKA